VTAHPDGPSRPPAAATVEARTLQASAIRRIWSTLLDYRDWTSYVYVPLLIPILTLMPYLVFKSYQRSHRLTRLVHSFNQGSRDLEKMSELLDNNFVPWTGEVPENVYKLDEPNLKGFVILQDSRIIDLRNWRAGSAGANDPSSLAYIHHRLKVVKLSENEGNNLFPVRLLTTSPKTATRFPTQRLRPRLRMCEKESSVAGEEECEWEVLFDFQRVPAGELVDLIMEKHSPGQYLERGQNGAGLSFLVQADTAELTMWILMPKGKEYREFGIVRHPTGKPGKVEAVRLVTEYLADDFTIIAFKLLALKPGYTYEVSWVYNK
jgi:hypothetical protein